MQTCQQCALSVCFLTFFFQLPSLFSFPLSLPLPFPPNTTEVCTDLVYLFERGFFSKSECCRAPAEGRRAETTNQWCDTKYTPRTPHARHLPRIFLFFFFFVNNCVFFLLPSSACYSRVVVPAQPLRNPWLTIDKSVATEGVSNCNDNSQAPIQVSRVGHNDNGNLCGNNGINGIAFSVALPTATPAHLHEEACESVSAFVLHEQSVKTDAKKRKEQNEEEEEDELVVCPQLRPPESPSDRISCSWEWVLRYGTEEEEDETVEARKNGREEADGCGSKPCSELCGELNSVQEVPTTRKIPQRKTPSQLAMEALEAMAVEEEAVWVIRRKKAAEAAEKDGREAATALSREEGEAALSRQATKKKKEKSKMMKAIFFRPNTSREKSPMKTAKREAAKQERGATTQHEEEVTTVKTVKNSLRRQKKEARAATTTTKEETAKMAEAAMMKVATEEEATKTKGEDLKATKAMEAVKRQGKEILRWTKRMFSPK